MVAKTVGDLVKLGDGDRDRLVVDDYFAQAILNNDNGNIPDFEIKEAFARFLRDSKGVTHAKNTTTGLRVMLSNGQEFVVSIF